jgi:hypothetical protein
VPHLPRAVRKAAAVDGGEGRRVAAPAALGAGALEAVEQVVRAAAAGLEKAGRQLLADLPQTLGYFLLVGRVGFAVWVGWIGCVIAWRVRNEGGG